jgi:membrane-bound serine protease (ClpP class)
MSGTIITLALVGIALIVAEMFLPGMIAGALGTMALIAATVIAYSTYGFETGNVTLGIFLALGVALFFAWLYIFPRSAFARKLTLSAVVKSATDHPDHRGLIGKEGVALTPLRPAGTALIEGERVDVLAESDFIAPQERIKVLQTEGAKVVVRKQSTL